MAKQVTQKEKELAHGIIVKGVVAKSIELPEVLRIWVPEDHNFAHYQARSTKMFEPAAGSPNMFVILTEHCKRVNVVKACYALGKADPEYYVTESGNVFLAALTNPDPDALFIGVFKREMLIGDVGVVKG